jgi:hypothetical protein
VKSIEDDQAGRRLRIVANWTGKLLVNMAGQFCESPSWTLATAKLVVEAAMSIVRVHQIRFPVRLVVLYPSTTINKDMAYHKMNISSLEASPYCLST